MYGSVIDPHSLSGKESGRDWRDGRGATYLGEKIWKTIGPQASQLNRS